MLVMSVKYDYAASESYYAVGLLLVMTVNMDMLCVMIGSDVCYDG